MLNGRCHSFLFRAKVVVYGRGATGWMLFLSRVMKKTGNIVPGYRGIFRNFVAWWGEPITYMLKFQERYAHLVN